MSDDIRINSKDYWEHRFETNWDQFEGPSQTTFFAETAMRLLPEWLRRDLASSPWKFADLGCAEGEGAALFKTRLPNLEVAGLDFSAKAIETAKSRHPDVQFRVADLSTETERFDVGFSSNVLEHFHDPRTLLGRMASLCREYLILVVPGWEYARHHEHHVTFTLADLPASVEGLALAHIAAVNCAPIDARQWSGYQILAVYAAPAAVERSGASAADVVRAAALPSLRVEDLDELVSGDPALASHVLRSTGSSTHTLSAWNRVAVMLEGLTQRNEALHFTTRTECKALFENEIHALGEVLEDRHARDDRLLQDLQDATREKAEAQARAESAEERERALEERLEISVARLDELQMERDAMDGILRSASRALEALDNQREAGGVDPVSRRGSATEDGIATRLDQVVATLGERALATRSEFSSFKSRAGREIAELRSRAEGLRLAVDLLEEDRARFIAAADHFREQLAGMHASSSWRASAPFRWIGATLTGRSAAGRIDALPGPLYISAEDLRPPLEGFLEEGATHAVSDAEGPEGAAIPECTDLVWDEFEAQVLSRRDEFKGVFVQELVIDWNVPLYQRPQHMASALARLGYLVIYRTGNWGGDDVNGFREVEPNVWLTNSVFTDGIEGAVRSVYSTAYATEVEALEHLPRSSVFVYEYIDHIDPKISGEPEIIEKLVGLQRWAFSGGADFIVASASVLHDEAIAAVGEARTIKVQNGVDTRHYRDPAQKRVPIPQSLHDFRGKYDSVIGYFGALAPWLWYDVIAELVKSRPDLGFVFIGPDYFGGSDRLPKSDNVLYLGTVDYRVLPGHARFFDVCFIPFEPGDIARTTSPLKLFEYFALEKPVVVTSDMTECVAHPEVFRGSGAAELSAAIDEALAVKDDPSFRRQWARLADENDWDHRAEAFAHAFSKLPRNAAGLPDAQERS